MNIFRKRWTWVIDFGHPKSYTYRYHSPWRYWTASGARADAERMTDMFRTYGGLDARWRIEHHER